MKWLARYKDGTCLHQFEGQTEHLFKEIDHDNLRMFELNGINGHINVDLATGNIFINSLCVDFPERQFKDAQFRLIYFRRVKQILGSGSPQTKYFLGWQANIDGRNYKRIVSANENTISIMCE